MLDMPILKFEKSKIYLNSQLQIQQNNKQLILDIIANIGSILNDASTDKKENFESILESANVFLQTITNNITMIEQLDIEIKNITKELNTLLSDKSKTKEYYIAAFTNLKQTIIVYSKKFSEIEKKLSFDNTNFNNFITVNNFKYNFESVENDNIYKFTGFTINDNEINVSDNNIDSIEVETEAKTSIETEIIDNNIDKTTNTEIVSDESTDAVTSSEISELSAEPIEINSNTDDIIISEDDLLEELLFTSDNELEESLFETNDTVEKTSTDISDTEATDNIPSEDDIVITENDLIDELLINENTSNTSSDSDDLVISEDNLIEELLIDENTSTNSSDSDDLVISEDDLIEELLSTESNEDTFLDLNLTDEIILDFENNPANNEEGLSSTLDCDSQPNDIIEPINLDEISDTELLEELLEESLNKDTDSNFIESPILDNTLEKDDKIENLDDFLLEDLSINDILSFDDEQDDEKYSNVLQSLDYYLDATIDVSSENNTDNTDEKPNELLHNLDDIIDVPEIAINDSTINTDIIDDSNLQHENTTSIEENIIITENINNEENKFNNIEQNETNSIELHNSISDEEIFETEDPFEDISIPVYSETSKIDELTTEFRSLLLDLSNNGISSDNTTSALISMFNQALGDNRNLFEKTNTISSSNEIEELSTSYKEIDLNENYQESDESYIEYLNNLSINYTDIQNIFKNQLLENMVLFEVDICDNVSPPLPETTLIETEITNEVQTNTENIYDNELLENSILENIITNDVTYTNEEITSFDIDTESQKVDYYNIDKEVIESIMNELNTDKNFIEQSENKNNSPKAFSSYSDLYNNIYMSSKKAEHSSETSCTNMSTTQETTININEQNIDTETSKETTNSIVTDTNNTVSVAENNVSNVSTIENTPTTLETNIIENVESINTIENNTSETIENAIETATVSIETQKNDTTTSTNNILTPNATVKTFPSISIETSNLETVAENTTTTESETATLAENTSTIEAINTTDTTVEEEIDIEAEVEASLVDELILSTNDISNDNLTSIEETSNSEEQTVPQITVPKESCSEKIEKIEKALEDNETLLISERTHKIYLPYKLFELQNYITSYPDAYSSLEDVVSKEFILPLDYFSAHPKKSRFSESYNLLRNREGKKMFKAFSYAIGIAQKSSLNPAIIASCKSRQELDHYIFCMESNSLDNFQNFNIVYEVNPAKK